MSEPWSILPRADAAPGGPCLGVRPLHTRRQYTDPRVPALESDPLSWDPAPCVPAAEMMLCVLTPEPPLSQIVSSLWTELRRSREAPAQHLADTRTWAGVSPVTKGSKPTGLPEEAPGILALPWSSSPLPGRVRTGLPHRPEKQALLVSSEDVSLGSMPPPGSGTLGPGTALRAGGTHSPPVGDDQEGGHSFLRPDQQPAPSLRDSDLATR